MSTAKQRGEYMRETRSRLAEIKARAQYAEHCVNRLNPSHAELINEAQRLQTHLKAWGEYIH